MKTLVVTALAACLLGSCATKESSTESTTSGDPVAELEAGVMASHDSTMGHMDDIMRLRKAVRKKLAVTDSLLKLGKKDAALQTDRERGEAIANDLNAADKGMMDWMHGYSVDTLKKLDQQKAMEYLKAEKAKIDKVNELTKKSLADAASYVQ